MMPSGRKRLAKSGKRSVPLVEEHFKKAYDSEKEEKELSGSEEAIAGEKAATILHGKKRTSADILEDMGGEVQNMLEKFGADINKALLAKRKRLEMYTKSALKSSCQKIDHVWKTQQEQRLKIYQDYSQQFVNAFQQWESDTRKNEEQEDKMLSMFQQHQKFLQQTRVVQSQRLKTIKQLYEQFVKTLEDLEKIQENIINGTQVELKKEMAMLHKKIMIETQQQQEMACVRKSLQSMLL